MTFFEDLRVMTIRSWKINLKNIDGLITMLVLPVMILLAFVYIFGGAIDKTGQYINYAMPGILIMGIGQVATGVAVTMSNVKNKGVLRRFKTMNISQSTILVGEMLTTLAKSLISCTFVFIIAMLLGFSPKLVLPNTFVLIISILLFAAVLIWMSLLIGLKASPEAAATVSFVFIFLPYLSSGFVPISTFPKVLQIIAKYSPLTSVIELYRDLIFNQPFLRELGVVLGWTIPTLFILVWITIVQLKKLD